MELILISSNKLKIILTEDEMKKYGLCDNSNISDKKQLNRLFEEIKRKSGFDTSGETVYVELFESICGGCEIFVTKEPKMQRASLIGSSAKKELIESIITYRFDSAKNLILAASRLNSLPDPPKSKLLSDEYDYFYLICTLKDACSDMPRLIFLDEYGERMTECSVKLYLDEHGRQLCRENAIEKLSAL